MKRMKKPILSIILILFLGMVSSVSVLATDSDSDFPFTDVYPTDSYYEAVKWAYENGITSGTAPDKFSPNSTCTRGQVVTFLWNLNGKPDASDISNPFDDVAENKYFYTAVLWAYSKGIVSGMTETTFSPESTCTKEQIIAMLYRNYGSPNVRHGQIRVNASEWAEDYVVWAEAEGICNQIEGAAECPRAEIVSYMYNSVNAKLHTPMEMEIYYHEGPNTRPGISYDMTVASGFRRIQCKDCDFYIQRDYNGEKSGSGVMLNIESGGFYVFIDGDFYQITVDNGIMYANGHEIGTFSYLIAESDYVILWYDDCITFDDLPSSFPVYHHTGKGWQEAFDEIHNWWGKPDQ